jgi:glycosyltransferase involved in cell wall biosynthesis
MCKVCILSSVHNALDNRIFYREACTLRKAGYEVSLIAVHDKPEIRQGITILPIKRLRRSRRPLLWWKLVRIALSTRADIYHIHDPELLFVSPIIKLLAHKPIIYDIHEANVDFIETKEDIPYPIRKFFAWLFRWFEPFMSQFQNGLIFADDMIAQHFVHIKRPKTTLFNFPNQSFIDNAFIISKDRYKKQPTVLHLGGLKRFRGTDLMLDSFQQVLKSVPEAYLYLVGAFAPASLELEFRSEIDRRNLTNSITITGQVPFAEIGTYLVQASVGWIPLMPVAKYLKNIPTKLFEYQAYAIPVVSSDLPSVQPFIEHRKTGLLVKADDPSAHAEAIVELLTDHSFASFIGINGQNAVRNQYRWSDMEPRLLTLYKQLLSKRT